MFGLTAKSSPQRGRNDWASLTCTELLDAIRATRASWASLVKREQMPALVETLDGVLAVVPEPLVASEHEIAYGG